MTGLLGTFPLGFPWATVDPFLFCVHHLDAYPKGTSALGPQPELLRGRNLGQDFEIRDGFRMYHGDVVPGFPQHPHRGFETITVMRQGVCDHSDSLGARARFAAGDVQWMTAGGGVVHSEMFPLLSQEAPNPLELFQIWLNLPRSHKGAAPHFSMLWREAIPERVQTDARGRSVRVTVAAGQLDGAVAPRPPPDSWASQADSNVAIWLIALGPSAQWTLPAGPEGVRRRLYLYRGPKARVAGAPVAAPLGIEVSAERPVELEAGPEGASLLMLQGRPIGEPVVQYGPFVMNTQAEIQQAFADYRKTQFGGWPWDRDDPVHGPDLRRFARYPDGQEQLPPGTV